MTTKTYQVRDGNGALQTFQGVDIGGGVILMQSVSSDAAGTPYDLNNPLPLYVPNYAAVLRSQSLIMLGGATPYAHGDLIADNASGGAVTAFQIANAARVAAGALRIERVYVERSGASIPANANVRVHFFAAAPAVITNGDNGAFLTNVANYAGAADLTFDRVFNDASRGSGLSVTYTPMTIKLPAGTTLFALIEARPGVGNTLTLGANETWAVGIEAYRF